MANVIRPVQDIQQRAQLGRITEDEKAEQYLRTLLARVNELEQSVLPFVRAFEINRAAPTELVSVYYRDLAAARDVMDPINSIPVPEDRSKLSTPSDGLMGEIF